MLFSLLNLIIIKMCQNPQAPCLSVKSVPQILQGICFKISLNLKTPMNPALWFSRKLAVMASSGLRPKKTDVVSVAETARRAVW